MSPKLKEMFFLLCAAGAILLALIFWARRGEITPDFPLVTGEMVAADAEKNAKAAEAEMAANRAKQRAAQARKVYACEKDDDCMRVEKHPCGCSEGPDAITAVNAQMIVEFNRTLPNVTAACAETASVERECSPSARPACVKNMCKMVF